MRKKVLVTGCLSFCLLSTVIPVSATSKPVISAKKITLTVGRKKKLKVKNTKKKVTWKTSKKKVAVVTSKGVVKAKKPGKAIVKASVAGKTYRCKVIVKKASAKPSGVSLETDTEEGWGRLFLDEFESLHTRIITLLLFSSEVIY